MVAILRFAISYITWFIVTEDTTGLAPWSFILVKQIEVPIHHHTIRNNLVPYKTREKLQRHFWMSIMIQLYISKKTTVLDLLEAYTIPLAQKNLILLENYRGH